MGEKLSDDFREINSTYPQQQQKGPKRAHANFEKIRVNFQNEKKDPCYFGISWNEKNTHVHNKLIKINGSDIKN